MVKDKSGSHYSKYEYEILHVVGNTVQKQSLASGMGFYLRKTMSMCCVALQHLQLQTMAYHLNIIERKYRMTISSTKTKSMAMWGNHIQRVKIVINENIIEQVTYFK